MERFEASTSPEYAMSADNAAADASRGDIAINRLLTHSPTHSLTHLAVLEKSIDRAGPNVTVNSRLRAL